MGRQEAKIPDGPARRKIIDAAMMRFRQRSFGTGVHGNPTYTTAMHCKRAARNYVKTSGKIKVFQRE
jgi:hypothetical protein